MKEPEELEEEEKPELTEEEREAALEKLETEIEELIRRIAAKQTTDEDEDEGPYEKVERLLKEADEDYDEDLSEFAFRTAIQVGDYDYVEMNADEFDLNDEGDCSSYLRETEDETMRELLIDCGAFESWDVYAEYRFACETVNGTILSFDEDLQKEAFEKYLEVNKLTREDILRELQDPDTAYEEDFENLGIALEDGELVLEDMTDRPGIGTKWLLEELGWDVRFEGQEWKLETAGVYFIQ